jgi:hypothetical protein
MDIQLARQRGTQVAHSLNVVAELPRYMDDRTVPVALRVAAGAVIVDESRAPSTTAIADPDGNKACRHVSTYSPAAVMPPQWGSVRVSGSSNEALAVRGRIPYGRGVADTVSGPSAGANILA